MTLPTLDGFTKKVADLLDRPNTQMTAIQLKEWFDAAPDELRVFLNARLAQIDTDFALKSELNGVTLGQFPDNSITAEKLAFNVETIEGSQAKADIAKAASIPLSQKGVANGVATLNSNGRLTQILDSFVPAYQADPYLSSISEGQIWRLTVNDPPEFKMKIGNDKYHINLKSIMTKYPTTGMLSYTGILFENGVFPKGKTVETSGAVSGVRSSVSLGGTVIMDYNINANQGGNAWCKLSFGVYDISLVREIKVTFRVTWKTGNENSSNFSINCAPQGTSGTLGTLNNFETPSDIGAGFTTVTRNVSAFLGWADIYLYCGTGYSNAGFANGMTVEVSKVELTPM